MMAVALAAACGASLMSAQSIAADKKSTYDPNTLLSQGQNPADIFLKEPRDDFWADIVEQTVAEQIQKDLQLLVPGAKIGLKCKKLSCVVGLQAPREKLPAAMAVAKLIMFGPSLVDVDPDKDGTQRWLFFCEPRMGDAKFFVDWYRRVRKTTLQAIKSGKRPNPLPFPPEKLPSV